MRCIGASKKESWIFDPFEVKEEILDFFQFERTFSNRNKDPNVKKDIEKFVAFLKIAK